MTIEAPLSRTTRTNFIIYIVACLVMALWFGYDGYFNQSFITKHTDDQGNPNSTLVFNRKAPPFLLGGAVLLGVYFYLIRGKRIVAGEDELVIAGKETISYDAIEQINKTYFERRGFFTITYKRDGREVQRKLSDRNYDNLGPVLDHLIAKIS